jgi:GTPase
MITHETPPDAAGEEAGPAAAGDGVPAGFRAGFAALVGRPNVGKSTLLNALLGTKLSIVTPKPQTTRHRIVGLLNESYAQIAFVDTPGLHGTHRRMLNQYMNRSAAVSLEDADVVVFLIEALTFAPEDEYVLERIRRAGKPAILVVNKVDRVVDKDRLLPFINELSRRHDWKAIVPVSASKRRNLEALPRVIAAELPESPPMYPPDQLTDRSEQFLATEIIREKLMLRLQDELPYGLTVEIERWQPTEDGRSEIAAVVWVERPGQKVIVIGEGGELLKSVGRAARLSLNQALGRRVHLELWVKVKENWADSANALKAFGYEGS